MSRSTRLGRRPLLAGLAALGMPVAAHAQAFPTGRVSFVVPFPPGASTDISTRIVADKLSQMWGQPVLIDNKGGANGIIAAEAVMRAKPDEAKQDGPYAAVIAARAGDALAKFRREEKQP